MVRRARRSAVLVGLVMLALTGCTTPPAAGPSATSAQAPTSGSQSTVSASTSSPTPRATPGRSASPIRSASSAPSVSSRSASSKPSATSSAGFDLGKRSIDDPRSIWVVVDKRRPLRPKSWVPEDLVQPAVPHTNVPQMRKPAADALVRLVAAARRDGVGVTSLSAYRPYTVQKSIYDRNVRSIGKAATEKLTARPGFSEHQTGLADDLGDSSGRCPIATCFATTPAGRWLASHAWRYGFVQRYPKGKQAVTGIQWEPWHYRYVGTGLAKHMHATGQTVLERVFDLPASPDYR